MAVLHAVDCTLLVVCRPASVALHERLGLSSGENEVAGIKMRSVLQCVTGVEQVCRCQKRGDGHNFTEECRDPTINLQHCMEEHRDYYQVHTHVSML